MVVSVEVLDQLFSRTKNQLLFFFGAFFEFVKVSQLVTQLTVCRLDRIIFTVGFQNLHKELIDNVVVTGVICLR